MVKQLPTAHSGKLRLEFEPEPGSQVKQAVVSQPLFDLASIQAPFTMAPQSPLRIGICKRHDSGKAQGEALIGFRSF